MALVKKFLFQQHIFDPHNKLKPPIRQFDFLRYVFNTALLGTLYFALITYRLQYSHFTMMGRDFQYIDCQFTCYSTCYSRVSARKHEQCERQCSFALNNNLKMLPNQDVFDFKNLRLFFVECGDKLNNIIHVTDPSQNIL